jgi:MoaA/NifB/PqqE/SkfB family radical SAM enzyme
MQNQHIKLDEIIYEITGRCSNKCSYCGSKASWNEEIDEDRVKKIVDAICVAKNRPAAIDISGGCPLLISLETHKYIVTKFNEAKIEAKILCNPKSLNIENIDKVLLYDWIGISVNTEDELKIWKDFKKSYYFNYKRNITIVSNFNVGNIFIFDKIKQIVKDKEMLWQIQYTMYNDPDNELALYNNDAARELFFNKIQKAQEEGVKIVLADNLIKGTCAAGLHSLGILSDGSIVPCLSMRSWNDDIKKVSQGNILEEDLDTIWTSYFNKYRFINFKSCREHCNNKCMIYSPVENAKCETTTFPEMDKNKWFVYPPQKTPQDKNNFYVYGVPSTEQHIILYGISTTGTIYSSKPTNSIPTNKELEP